MGQEGGLEIKYCAVGCLFLRIIDYFCTVKKSVRSKASYQMLKEYFFLCINESYITNYIKILLCQKSKEFIVLAVEQPTAMAA